jgi:predicted TIM-barrel fold metal-dependent hydrolase
MQRYSVKQARRAPESRTSKFRNVRGGLDNAVRQAEERKLDSINIIDADCHQREPFTLFLDYLPEQWKKIVDERNKPYMQEEDPFLSGKDQGIGKLVRGDVSRSSSWRYNEGRIKRPESEYASRPQNPEDLVDMFARRMHDIGIKKSVVLPTSMLSLGFDPRLDFEVAIANAYVDYMKDNFLGKYPEILTMIYGPCNSPKETSDLIDRAGSVKGIVGIMVTAGRHSLGGDNSWDPIFEAAERKNLPICFHGVPYLGGTFAGFDKFISIHALSFPFFLMVQLTSVVMAGIPERFPKLKFAFMEGGVSWVPWIMHRLDSEYIMRRYEAPVLKDLPSEYIKKFYFTSQPLERPSNIDEQEKIFEMFDAENHLMYASDYPHWDFDAPSVIYDLPFLTKPAKKKILGENAARFLKMN